MISTGCATTGSVNADSHTVLTINETDASNCTYLYSTKLKENASNSSIAAANAIHQLKDQAQLTNGNAIRVTNIFNSTEWNYGYGIGSIGSYGFNQDTAEVSVEVYNCPDTAAVP